jgi:hypothetical protein
MTTDLTAELCTFAADVQSRATALFNRIQQATPTGCEPNLYVGYLPLAGDLLADAARQMTKQGLYLDAEPTDLDTADPDIDRLLADLANA